LKAIIFARHRGLTPTRTNEKIMKLLDECRGIKEEIQNQMRGYLASKDEDHSRYDALQKRDDAAKPPFDDKARPFFCSLKTFHVLEKCCNGPKTPESNSQVSGP